MADTVLPTLRLVLSSERILPEPSVNALQGKFVVR